MDDPKETGRIEAFSDGVFAVAITLLVLNIQVPSPLPPDTDLIAFLFRHQWPYYLAFLTSFATIGIMWINHHRLYSHIKRSDNTLMVLNLLLLLIIVFIPFPTALLAQYIFDPNEHQAAVFYSGVSCVMAICFNLLWRYAAHENRLLARDADQHAVKAITNQYMLGPLLYLITFGVAWISGPVCIALNLLLAVFFALPGKRLVKQGEGENEAA
jgi:uncharacterized membrane protein